LLKSFDIYNLFFENKFKIKIASLFHLIDPFTSSWCMSCPLNGIKSNQIFGAPKHPFNDFMAILLRSLTFLCVFKKFKYE